MKKFIALTIGLSLLGAALIVPMSDASREAYHSYIAKKVRESGRFRRFAPYRGTRNIILLSQRDSLLPKVSRRPRPNYRYLIPHYGKRNFYQGNPSNPNLKLRTFTKRVFGISVASKTNHRLTFVAKEKPSNGSFRLVNYNNDLFTLEIPANSQLNEKDGEIEFSLPLSSVKFSAKKLNSKCTENLSLCARAISRTVDYKNDIYRSSKTVQQYQRTDAVLGEVGLDSKKFVEGFIGTKFGKDYFFGRFVVEGKNGDVFLIEVQSDLDDVDEAVVLAKKVFASFRAKY